VLDIRSLPLLALNSTQPLSIAIPPTLIRVRSVFSFAKRAQQGRGENTPSEPPPILHHQSESSEGGWNLPPVVEFNSVNSMGLRQGRFAQINPYSRLQAVPVGLSRSHRFGVDGPLRSAIQITKAGPPGGACSSRHDLSLASRLEDFILGGCQYTRMPNALNANGGDGGQDADNGNDDQHLHQGKSRWSQSGARSVSVRSPDVEGESLGISSLLWWMLHGSSLIR
jgi:hypothetical protein